MGLRSDRHLIAPDPADRVRSARRRPTSASRRARDTVSNQTVSPGALLAGRYRIAELLAEIDGARVWRAVDEVLSRAVVVDVLPVGDPRTNLLFDAARRAAAAADPRFLRVLDCDMHDGVTYCVREWAGGRPLERMLGTGPLTGQQAGWLAREVSEALENLHRTGHAHGSISPSTVVVTDAGAIKVVGLATEAALRSTGPGSPEQDVHALGELLYASLTGRWPGPAPAWGLQPAPRRARPAAEPAPGARRRTALAGRHLRPAARRPAAAPRRRRSPARPACPRRCPESSAARTSRRTRWTRPSRSPGRTAASTTPPRSSRRRRPPALDPTPPPGVPVGATATRQHPAYATAGRDAAASPPDAAAVERQRPARPPADEPKPKGGWGGRILILLAVLALLSVVAMAQFLLKGAIEQATRTATTRATAQPRRRPQPDAVDRRRGQDRQAPRTSTRSPRATARSTPTTSPNTYDGKASTTWTTHVVQATSRTSAARSRASASSTTWARSTAVSKVTVALRWRRHQPRS